MNRFFIDNKFRFHRIRKIKRWQILRSLPETSEGARFKDEDFKFHLLDLLLLEAWSSKTLGLKDSHEQSSNPGSDSA